MIKDSIYEFRKNEILTNPDKYPKSLVESVPKRDEIVHFVYEYEEKKDLYKDKEISIKEEYVKGKIPYFIQWDERWGYDMYGTDIMGINGCGPTTIAMVAVGLTGNTDINPRVVAKFSDESGYYVPNVGTRWTLMTDGAKNFGIESEQIEKTVEAIKLNLKSGKPIIASMGPGHFTTGGHFIILVSIDENDQITIKDPISRVKTNKKWDINIVVNECKALWAFNKK